jgi:hypothetical protein
MIGHPSCQRATLRRYPLRNEPVPYCGVTQDGVICLVAVHGVYVGEKDVVGEIAPDGRIVYRALDGERFQVYAVADTRVQEDCWSSDSASREDDFFCGVDVIEWGCIM